MRAVGFIVGTAFLWACSIGALDGFAGPAVPDAGPMPSEGGGATDAPSDALATLAPPIDGTVTSSAYHLAVAADAPVAHFPLEEPSGAACASSTTKSSATCVYPPDQITRGQPGIGGTKALRLDTANVVLSISGLPSDLSQPYTFELWLRVDSVVEHTSFGAFRTLSVGVGNGWILTLWNSSPPFTRLRTETWNQGTHIAYGVAPAPLTPAVWHHVAIVHTPNPHADLFYVDGALVEGQTLAPAAPRPVVTDALTMGGFVGYLDEIAIYDKALPAARISAHYAAQ